MLKFRFKTMPQNPAEWDKVGRDIAVIPDANSVGTEELLNGNVTTDKIAPLAVTAPKIAAQAVSVDKLALAGSDGQFPIRRAGVMVYDTLIDTDIPATLARDTEVIAAVAAHEGAPDPHPQYTTSAELATALGPYALLGTTGTFTITLTGVNATVTGTARWSKIGKLAVLVIPALSGTSNTGAMTLTGAPAAIQPANAQRLYIPVTDNGTTTLGVAQVETSGVITLGVGLANGSFTGSGTKGVLAVVITYSLD